MLISADFSCKIMRRGGIISEFLRIVTLVLVCFTLVQILMVLGTFFSMLGSFICSFVYGLLMRNVVRNVSFLYI